ncbi:MAG: GNAT family N-acetyltransferase [Planctomycetes bacterium]|nr:GNAT family N-acetyltransferase [Planctomycetota bacterium]
MASAESLGEGVKIRRACESDRAELLDEINLAFMRAGGSPRESEEDMPYLFTPGRIDNHFIAERDGKILSVVGAYPYDVRLGGVTFKAAGIGQVSTRKEARGTGLMGKLLERISRFMFDEGMDFSWLSGDRLRYGRYGWASGGAAARFDTYDKYLPPPPDEKTVRQLEFPRDVPFVRTALGKMPNMVLMGEDELELLLGTGKHIGLAMNGTFIIHNASMDVVEFADGPADEIALLLAHLASEIRRLPGDHWKFTVECPLSEPSELLKACYRHYWKMQVDPSARFKVVRLVNFLEKVCRMFQGRLPAGSGELGLVNKDTGESATIVCRDGQSSVQAGAAGGAYTLDRREISEVCFGACPLDVLLPDLPANSPIRCILPLKAFISRFFAI